MGDRVRCKYATGDQKCSHFLASTPCAVVTITGHHYVDAGLQQGGPAYIWEQAAAVSRVQQNLSGGCCVEGPHDGMPGVSPLLFIVLANLDVVALVPLVSVVLCRNSHRRLYAAHSLKKGYPRPRNREGGTFARKGVCVCAMSHVYP